MSQKPISNTNCCVYGCHSRKFVNPSLSFHTFPKPKANCVQITNKSGAVEKVDQRQAWELKLLMGKPVTPTMLVCSLHFLKEDFYLPDIPTCRPRLKKTAVPTRNLPKKKCYEEKSEEQKIKRYQRLASRRATRTDVPVPSTSSASSLTSCDIKVTDINNEDLEETWTQEDRDAAEVLLSIGYGQPSLPAEKTTEESKSFNKATQVKSGDLLTPFVANINSDAKLSSATGIPNFKVLNMIVSLCKKFPIEKRQRKLSLTERIILTFIRLKNGIKFVVVSMVFNNVVTANTCRIIFHETICLLAKVLRPFIRWPTLTECQNNMPKCFKNFTNVRVVLDCTEIPLAVPKCLHCRIRTYSHYKGRQTIKVMTGVSPAGVLTFISSAYGGKASDKAIFEQSGIVKKLCMCVDAVMVDKGFHIKDICNSYGIKVIQPPYLYKSKKQLTKEEALLNVSIARARVHIERYNQRIKVFEIFSKPLPWSFVPIINEIFTVVCAVINLSAPILADDKFI